MSSANRFVETADFTTIPTYDLLRLVIVYIDILFYIFILFQLHSGKPSSWSEQQCFDSLCAEGRFRTEFLSSMTRACLRYNPPWNGPKWLSGEAAAAAKDILAHTVGPRQNRHAVRAREGTLDGFTARLVELESRRWLFLGFASYFCFGFYFILQFYTFALGYSLAYNSVTYPGFYMVSLVLHK